MKIKRIITAIMTVATMTAGLGSIASAEAPFMQQNGMIILIHHIIFRQKQLLQHIFTMYILLLVYIQQEMLHTIGMYKQMIRLELRILYGLQ